MKDYQDILKDDLSKTIDEVSEKPVEPNTDELFGDNDLEQTEPQPGGFLNFFKRNAFYIAIVVAVSAASYVSYNAVMGMIEDFTKPSTEKISEEKWTDTKQSDISVQAQPQTPVPQQQDTPTEPSLPSSSSAQEPILPDSADLPVESSNTETSPVGSFVLPVVGQITKGFSGDKLVFCETMGDWRTHNGIDITAEQGTSVVAVTDGTVEFAGQSDLWGLVVEVKLITGHTAIYANLGSIADIKAGTLVKQGDVLGSVGTSSIIEKGDKPHLHFEIISGDKFLDPLTLLNDQ